MEELYKNYIRTGELYSWKMEERRIDSSKHLNWHIPLKDDINIVPTIVSHDIIIVHLFVNF